MTFAQASSNVASSALAKHMIVVEHTDSTRQTIATGITSNAPPGYSMMNHCDNDLLVPI